ncbi:MAG TPA: thioredoxin-like domain-containing protein [Verrucomicrobiae bacterium]|nr:thioredoxin-like domain-containing protein [Verrucomicrobiae bacterium]
MKSFIVCAAIFFTARFASAQSLTWPQLVQHPELWPSQCTLKRGFDFQSGASVKAGQTVAVLEIHANQMVVGTLTGKAISFDVKPDDTDALAMANAAYAKLTPKQRALTYAAIFQNKDLWPYYLTLKDTFDLDGGHRVNKGDRVIFRDVENGKLEVGVEKFNTVFDLEPTDTDLMEQVRKFVEDPNGAPSRLIAELQPNLIGSTTGQPSPLDTNSLPRYLVFLRGGNFCPICQQFIPSLVKFYNETKPKHPEFEIIYLSCDGNAAEMAKFAKAEGFSWLAVSYERSGYLFQVIPYFKPPIPQLTVMDQRGHVLISGVGEMQNGTLQASAASGGGTAVSGQQSAADALQQFAALLDKQLASK